MEEELIKNGQEAFTPRVPDYAGDGVKVWLSKDKNGKTYLKVTVLGGKAINCFSTIREEETKSL